MRLARGARGILAASAKEWEMMVRSSCLMPSILRAEVQGAAAAAAASGAETGEARIVGVKRVVRRREIVGVEKSMFGFDRWDGYVVPGALRRKYSSAIRETTGRSREEREGILPKAQNPSY